MEKDDFSTLHFALPIPFKAGKCIGIAEFQGRVIIACEWEVYEYVYVNMMPKLIVVAGVLRDFTHAAKQSTSSAEPT